MNAPMRWQDVHCLECNRLIADPAEALIQHDSGTGGLKGKHIKCPGLAITKDQAIVESAYWNGISDAALLLKRALQQNPPLTLEDCAETLARLAQEQSPLQLEKAKSCTTT